MSMNHKSQIWYWNCDQTVQWPEAPRIHALSVLDVNQVYG